MSKIVFQKNYRPTRRIQKECKSPSRTKQQFKDECDIDSIMLKFQKTGTLAHLNNHHGQYGDFAQPVDYHDAMNTVLAAREMFSSVPSSIRSKFANDPALFLEFVQNPENEDQLIEMGLAHPKISLDVDTPEPSEGASAKNTNKGAIAPPELAQAASEGT